MVKLNCDGHEINILPERGAIICSWTYNGKKIFLEDAHVLEAPIIRGGMPILFPLCGELEDNTFMYKNKVYKLKRHGFARDCKWDVISVSFNTIVLQLKASPKTYENYPFLFELTVQYVIIGNELRVSSTVKNNSEVPMPYQIGFHPYFYTTSKEFSALAFNWDKEVTNILPLKESVNLRTPDFHMMLTNINGFDHAVLWSLSDMPFICIEPWLGKVGALQSTNCTYVLPNRKHRHDFVVSIGNSYNNE